MSLKSTAKLPALDQIKRYMKFWTKKYKIKAQNMTGIILAKSIDPDLYKALSRATNIESRTYFFSVELK